ncbi:GPR endopeptidase [Eubacterium sp.]
MINRTDLAVECYEENEKTALSGVKITEKDNITTVEVINENGAESLGKPVGKYVVLDVNSFVNDTDILDGRLDEFSAVLKSVMPQSATSVLVVGLGNKKITADSLGPSTSSFILATRHIADNLESNIGLPALFPVSCVNTGVLGDTGIETVEIIKGIVNQTKPSCVIAVDALAASSADRLGTTIQFSDSGISPGSGVGNHRHEISKATVGVPVIAVGIPTVVSTGIISGNGNDDVFVTPREIDRICQQGAKLIGMGINVCLQKNLSVEDLLALVG